MIVTKQLLIHAGYGKTATTWLQRKIFPNIPDSIYLGKDPFLSKQFERLHYKLFTPFYSIDKYYARNSAMMISDYAKMIKDVVYRGPQNIKKVVISDKCMMDYENYNDELNMYLLEQLKRKLVDVFYDVKLLITIRSQETWLLSYFAYDYNHLKKRFRNFDEFLDYGYTNPFETVWGGASIRSCIF